jgi:propionyl-CoA carboxylase beta chain
VAALDGYGRIFERNVRSSGVIPQISLIMGPCAGGAVYSPAITDFIFQVDGTSHMFITGPDVIKTVTGEDVTFEELGGAFTHASKSGVTHFVMPDGETALETVRYLLSFVPQNNMEMPPYFAPSDSRDRIEDSLDRIIPDSANQPYDMVALIAQVVDDGEFFQVTSTSPRTSWWVSPGSTVTPSASSPTSRRCWPARSTSRRPRRRLVSSASATPSTFPS